MTETELLHGHLLPGFSRWLSLQQVAGEVAPLQKVYDLVSATQSPWSLRYYLLL